MTGPRPHRLARGRRRLATLACVILVSLLATPPLHASPMLVDDGRSDYQVVIAADANAAQRFAAEELVEHLRQISGAVLPIVELGDGQAPPTHAIVLGSQNLLATLDLALDEALAQEQYLLRTVDGRLLIVGGEPRGTLYGVYDLLHELGVRWWTPRETHIPSRPSIALPQLDRREAPGLAYRDIMSRQTHGEEGQLWMARNRLNGMIWKDTPEHLGGRYPFGGHMLAHTLMSLLRNHDIEITPEMMSMNARGERAAPGSRAAQLCFTSARAIEAMTAAVLAEYHAQPDINFVMLGQEDGYAYCHCDDCQAIADAQQAQSGPVVHFANAVAEAAERDVEGAAVAINAYVWSRTPPANLRPRDNVYVVIASYEVDFATPLADSEHWPNWQFKQDLQRWNAITEKLFVWDYVVNFHHYLLPHPNLDVLAPNLRYYAEHGVVGVMEQGAWNTWYAENAPLRQWVLARALWDPHADNDALIDEFVTGYYGQAAPAVADAIDALHSFVRDNPDWPLVIYRHTNSPHIQPTVIARAQAAFDRAAHLADATGDDKIIRRVRHAHMPVRYALLKMGPGSPMWRAAEREMDRTLPVQEVADGFLQAVEDYDINEVGEGLPGAAFFAWAADYARLTDDNTIPAPAELADADWRHVRLIQACQLDRGADRYRRADGASDGWALRMGFGRDQRLHHLSNTNDYTPGQTYRAFVRVRGVGVTDDAQGPLWSCRIGDAAPATLDADLLRDGQWHTVELGEIDFDETGTAFIAELLWRHREHIDAVEIDCLWLEPVPR